MDHSELLNLFIPNPGPPLSFQFTDDIQQGALTNSPVRLSHYMGVWRGFLAAGEAICFSVDSVKIPYRTFAGGILTVYSMGIVVLFFLTATQVEETCYFKEGEQGVVVPNYIREKTTAPTKHAPERPMMQIAAVIQDRR